MNKDLVKGIGITLGGIAIIGILLFAGIVFEQNNSPTQEDLEVAYTMGAFNVANQALKNNYVNICDMNENCVVLYSEEYVKALIEQQQQGQSVPDIEITNEELN